MPERIPHRPSPRLHGRPALGLVLAVALVAAAEASPGGPAGRPLLEGVEIRFATVEEGQALLTSRDAFIERLSPFDRAARLGSADPVSEEAFLAFVARHVVPWDDEGRRRVGDALESLREGCARHLRGLPERIDFVLTTGGEEGGAAYTRGNSVILPAPRVASAEPENLRRLLAHELVHVFSRHRPAARERLYAAIGFHPCNEIELPTGLRDRRVTNPDAPRNDHFIRLEFEGRTGDFVPVLLADDDRFDPVRVGPFFRQMRLHFLEVATAAGGGDRAPILDDDRPRLATLEAVSDAFHRQAGRNTGYIIHPEEIIADNVALLVTGQAEDVPSPGILRTLEAILLEEAGRAD